MTQLPSDLHNPDQRLVTVYELPEFRRSAERFMSESEIAALTDYLAQNPLAGVVMARTGGVRKLRWALAGTGKSGGMRTIYFFQDERYPLLLVTAYAKASKDNITAAERNAMLRLVEAIKAERKNR